MSGRARLAGALVLLGLLVAAPSGCGYRLTGQGTVLPSHVKAFFVSPFVNETSRPEIEQRITEALAIELAQRGRYKVVPRLADADAIVEGAVTQYRAAPVQFTEELLANRIEGVVKLRATVRDLTTDEVLWSQDGLIFTQQYEVLQGELFFNQELLAFDLIARDAANALVTSILEGF